MAIRTGAYTIFDFKDVPSEDADSIYDFKTTTIGMSMGGAYLSGDSSTSLSLNYTYEFGQMVAEFLDLSTDIPGQSYDLIPISAWTIAVVLSGTVDIESVFGGDESPQEPKG